MSSNAAQVATVEPAQLPQTDTVQPSATPTEPIPHRTPEPTSTEIPVFINESVSPDGRYIVTSIRYGPYVTDDGRYVDASLFVKPVNGDVRIVLTEVTYSTTGLDSSVPTFVGWSADGDFVYYTNRIGGDGCVTWANGNDLQKVNVHDGSQEQILSAELREWRVSPDGSRLAYVNLWDAKLTILDLTTEEQTTVNPQTDKPLHRIIWSPEGSRLAVTAYQSICEERSVNDVIVIDTIDFTQKTFPIPDDEELLSLSAYSWLDENQLLIKDPYYREWGLDLITGDFLPIAEE